MRDEKQIIYTVSWTQPYNSWPAKEEVESEEITDFTEAQQVLARIMAK